MVLIRVVTQMLEMHPDAELERVARRSMDAITNHHYNPDFQLINELLNHDLSLPQNEYAQLVYTGHCIETLWMLMKEAERLVQQQGVPIAGAHLEDDQPQLAGTAVVEDSLTVRRPMVAMSPPRQKGAQASRASSPQASAMTAGTIIPSRWNRGSARSQVSIAAPAASVAMSRSADSSISKRLRLISTSSDSITCAAATSTIGAAPAEKSPVRIAADGTVAY